MHAIEDCAVPNRLLSERLPVDSALGVEFSSSGKTGVTECDGEMDSITFDGTFVMLIEFGAVTIGGNGERYAAALDFTIRDFGFAIGTADSAGKPIVIRLEVHRYGSGIAVANRRFGDPLATNIGGPNAECGEKTNAD